MPEKGKFSVKSWKARRADDSNKVMEKNNTPNSDFENFLRKHLQETHDSPDADLWNKIAEKQAPANRWMKVRRYGWYATAATLLLAVALVLRPGQNRPDSTPQSAQNTQPQSVTPEQSVTKSQSADEHQVVPVNTKTAQARALLIPNFSPRVNSVPISMLHFNAAKGLHYQHPVTKTVVEIPANSLVNASGAPVSGDAELYFREYRSIADFLASGLPMHYGDDRGDFFFNSGGMVEVRVSQAGEPLYLAEGKTYDLVFAPTSSLDKASLYYLDDQTAKWSFIPDASLDQADLKQPPISTELDAVKGNKPARSGNCMPDPYDVANFTDPADMLQTGIQTGLALASGKLQMPRWFLKNPYLTDDQLLFRMEKGMVQLKKHRDQAQLFFPEDLNHYFTELSAFKNCYFTYNADSLKGARQSRNLTNQDYWQRVVVEQVKNTECVITLYDGKEGQLQFHASLHGNTDFKNFDPDFVLKEYARLRQKRQRDFAAQNQALRYFLQSAPPFKTEEEYCMPTISWLDYFEKNHALMANRYEELVNKGYTTDHELATAAWNDWRKKLRNFKFQSPQMAYEMGQATAIKTLAYSLRLFKFGVYNYDQIFRLGGGQGVDYVMANYKTDKGEEVIPASICVLEKGSKLFFSQPKGTQILYLPGRWLDFIFTDHSGRQFILPADVYAKQQFNKKGVTVLTLNEVTDKTDSPQAWADLLNI